MAQIILEGVLSKASKKNWSLNVSSVLEAFQAIAANDKKFARHLVDLGKTFTHFAILVNGKFMDPSKLGFRVLEKNSVVRIVPVLQGGWFVALTIAGIVLTVLSIVLSYLLSPRLPKDVNTSSFSFGSIQNVEKRNTPVPIGYGKLRVGSNVVSNKLITIEDQLIDYGQNVTINSSTSINYITVDPSFPMP